MAWALPGLDADRREDLLRPVVSGRRQCSRAEALEAFANSMEAVRR
jgi:hypothetical protein